MQNRFISSIFPLLIGLYLLPGVATAQSGTDLYSSNCSRCHHDVSTIPGTAQEIKAILEQGTVRKHKFVLSKEQIANIVDYIQAEKR